MSDPQEHPIELRASNKDGVSAQWIVSEFRASNIPARLLVSALYVFFGIMTGLKTRKLADHRPILRPQGFRLLKASYSRGGLVVSELWER